MMMPPTELTASTTTVKFAAFTASTSTAGRARTASRCLSVKSSSSTVPRLSTSAKENASEAARSRTAWPSIAVRNSPLSFRSLRAFHWRGLWLAVRMMPPSSLANRTAISVVGVEAKPHLTTSMPHPMRVPTTSCSTMSPDRRASLPTTTLYRSPLGCGFRWGRVAAYAAVNLTISTGVRALPGAPPMVPRMPEMDLISVITCSFIIQN